MKTIDVSLMTLFTIDLMMLHCKKNTTHKRPSLPISRLISHLQDQFYLIVPGKIHSKNVIIGKKNLLLFLYYFWRKKNLTEELANLFGCVLIVKCILCYQIVSKLLFLLFLVQIMQCFPLICFIILRYGVIKPPQCYRVFTPEHSSLSK